MCWPEAIPLAGVAAEECAAAFISGWVSCFGVLAALTSDRGVQFSSALWAAVMAQLGIKHKMTTAFHPQSNGLVERFHRRLKDALRAWATAADWSDHMPWVLLGLRAAPREDSGISAAELVYGAPVVLPGQLLNAAEPPSEEFVRQLTSGTPWDASAEEVSTQAAGALKKLMAARFVYVRSPATAPSLSPVYRGLYKVHKRAEKFFIIRLGGRFDAISVDWLKPHMGSTVELASLPRRGRPPGRTSR
jgi:hypothetical protein